MTKLIDSPVFLCMFDSCYVNGSFDAQCKPSEMYIFVLFAVCVLYCNKRVFQKDI